MSCRHRLKGNKSGFSSLKGPSIKDVRIKGGDGGHPNADSCGQGGRGLIKLGCPHFEKFCKFIFEIAQGGNCLCN